MVSLQEQFNMACEQARTTEHAIVGVVTTAMKFKALSVELKDGEEYNHRSLSIKFSNGSQVRWLDSDIENLAYFAGYQLTTLFVADQVRGDVVRALQTRLRSSKFKGPLKTYYPHGHVVWEVWERYGS